MFRYVLHVFGHRYLLGRGICPLFGHFGGFGGFVLAISVLLVVLFQLFHLGVSGFSTCPCRKVIPNQLPGVRSFSFYYVDKSVLVGNRPRV